MKTTLIALAAASMISLGTAATASAAPNAGLDVSAGKASSVQKVRGRGRGGYTFHGPDYGFRRYCQDLYYKGWVLDLKWAQIQYKRECSYRSY